MPGVSDGEQTIRETSPRGKTFVFYNDNNGWSDYSIENDEASTWVIRNFDSNIDGELPNVLWREMNFMNVDEQKKYLEKSWYGHTSAILTKKFVNDVVLNWEIFK